MIYWNGCSFVQGMELVQPLKDGFPHLVSKHFNQECKKQSKVGGSNERMFRTSTQYLAFHKPKLAVFCWTTPNRFEYLAEGNNWRNAGWSSFGFDKRKLEINPEFSQIVKHPGMSRKLLCCVGNLDATPCFLSEPRFPWRPSLRLKDARSGMNMLIEKIQVFVNAALTRVRHEAPHVLFKRCSQMRVLKLHRA